MGKSSSIISIKKIKSIDEFETNIEAIRELFEGHIDPIVNAIIANKGKTRKILINHFLIKLVSVVENYCKNKIISIINENNFDVNKLFSKTEALISIEAIDEIKKKEFTKGRLVVTNFNFQNPDDINFVFSKLLNIDFFEIVKETTKYRKKGSKYPSEFQNLIRNWDRFLGFFEIRNQLVHSLKSLDYRKFSNNRIERIYYNFFIFLLSVNFTSAWIVFIRNGKSPTKKQIDIFNFYKNQIKK